MKKSKILKNTYFNYLGPCVIGLLSVLLFIRLRYGFDQTDESYYYALAKRFYQGDIPFVDEWYPSQIYSVLLLPFYGLYNFFVPSGDGIIIAGRYAYLVVQIIVSFFSLYCFREQKEKAVFITVLYMVCSRQNIPGLSYYNLYLTSCFVLSMLIYRCIKKGNTLFGFLIIGICCSVAALCMPYFALFAIALGIILIVKKQYKDLFSFVGSIMLCAAIYIVFLLSKAPLSVYIKSIGYVLSNPDYADHSIIEKIIGTVLSIGKVCAVEIPGLLYLLFSKEEKKKNICFIASLLVGSLIFGIYTPGAIFIQATFLAFPYVLKVMDKKDQEIELKLGITLYYLGIIFAVLFWLGSDTEASCLPLGLLISVIGIVSIMYYNCPQKVFVIAGLILCISAASARLLGPCYRDANVWKLDKEIADGPAKGLYTEQSDVEDYTVALELIKQVNSIDIIENADETKILFSKFLPWAYLATDFRNASMTPWRTSISDERLQLYYDINPEQFPDIVIIFSEEIGETNGLSGGEKMNASNPQEGKIWEKLKASNKIVTADAGTIYFIGN